MNLLTLGLWFLVLSVTAALCVRAVENGVATKWVVFLAVFGFFDGWVGGILIGGLVEPALEGVGVFLGYVFMVSGCAVFWHAMEGVMK